MGEGFVGSPYKGLPCSKREADKMKEFLKCSHCGHKLEDFEEHNFKCFHCGTDLR